MPKSNESEDDDFWETDYEPSEKVRKGLDQSVNKVIKTASLSFDGEQYYVRFPQEIENILGLTKEHKIKFIAREYSDDENTIDIELVKPEDD